MTLPSVTTSRRLTESTAQPEGEKKDALRPHGESLYTGKPVPATVVTAPEVSMARIKSLPASTTKRVFVTSSKDSPRGAENLEALAAPSAYPAAVAQEPANVPSEELGTR